MSNRLPPVVAMLARGGSTPARLVAALAEADALIAALEVDLDDHPLCRAPDWLALMPSDGEPSALAAILARLGEAREAPVPAPRHGAGVAAVQGAAPSSHHLAQAARNRRPTGVAATAAPEPPVVRAPADAPPARPGASPARPGAPPAVIGDAGARRAVGTAFPRPAHRTSGAAAADPAASLIPQAGDPVLRAAAARRVAQTPLNEAARLVRDLLDGTGSDATALPSGDAEVADPVDQRLARILDRLPAAGQIRPGQPAARNAAPPCDIFDSATRRSDPPAPEAEPAPAPRNGLERLLVRARRESLVPPGQSEGRQARLSPAHAAAAHQTTAPAADLPWTHRTERSRAPAIPGAAVGDPEDFARALADLLRREARAAGIDIGRER